MNEGLVYRGCAISNSPAFLFKRVTRQFRSDVESVVMKAAAVARKVAGRSDELWRVPPLVFSSEDAKVLPGTANSLVNVSALSLLSSTLPAENVANGEWQRSFDI